MTSVLGELIMEDHDSWWDKTKEVAAKVPFGAISGSVFWGAIATLNFIDASILLTAGLGFVGVLYGILFVGLGCMSIWLVARSIKYNRFLA